MHLGIRGKVLFIFEGYQRRTEVGLDGTEIEFQIFHNLLDSNKGFLGTGNKLTLEIMGAEFILSHFFRVNGCWFPYHIGRPGIL